MSFLEFINEFKGENEELIECVISAYNVLFEYPHTKTQEGLFDLHVEDVLQNEGSQQAVQYVEQIQQCIDCDQPLDIKYTRKGEPCHMDHPSFIEKHIVDQLDNLKDYCSNF